MIPRHFAYTWGVPVPGALGRNDPGIDRMLLHRVPVRGTELLPFFQAKLAGRLGPERTYERTVQGAKCIGASG